VKTSGEFISRLLNKKQRGIATSINDLRDKEFSGVKLNIEERLALANFDRYRLGVLNAEQDEEVFHQKYRQIQVIANLCDWKEFLKEDFAD
jgi:hypothetical protein